MLGHHSTIENKLIRNLKEYPHNPRMKAFMLWGGALDALLDGGIAQGCHRNNVFSRLIKKEISYFIDKNSKGHNWYIISSRCTFT